MVGSISASQALIVLLHGALKHKKIRFEAEIYKLKNLNVRRKFPLVMIGTVEAIY
jgi:hypothetical protein